MGTELKTDRAAAKAAGDKFYQGKPCRKHGHDGKRYTNSKSCFKCEQDRGIADHPDAGPFRESAAARRAAVAEGKRVYDGMPCPFGHDGKRYTSCGGCVTCQTERSAARWKSDPKPEQRRETYLKRQYGIGSSEYDAMMSSQGARCAICGRTPEHTSRLGLHVDHNHSTGEVRELLCTTCNQGLGSFYDNPVTLRAAADYIEKHAAIAARQDHGGASQTS